MKILNYLHLLKTKFRRYRLNARPGVSIAGTADVDCSVIFDLHSEGGGVIRIDDNVHLAQGVLLSPHGGTIHLQKNVYIGPYCVIYGHGGVTIESDSMIAAHSVVIPANHGYEDPNCLIRNHPLTMQGVHIGHDVWIGCGARILDGVSIGDGCVVGAGSVVTRSIAPYSVAVGVPAKVIRSRSSPERLTCRPKLSVASDVGELNCNSIS